MKGVTGIRELNYKFMFIANNVIVQNRQYHDVENTTFAEEEDQEDIDEKEKKKDYS